VAGRMVVTFGRDVQALDGGLASAEILLCGYFDHSRLAGRAPYLRWVQSIFAGVDKLAPYVPAGVTLTSTSGMHARKAGEYALGAMIMLNNAVPRFLEAQKAARWQPIFTPSLADRTVVILGVGRMGQAIARQALHFGMRVVGVGRTPGPRPDIDECYAIDDLHKVLPGADFLVLMAPNTAETQRLIGQRELDLLPDHAGLVSLGRGQILDQAALTDTLDRGRLAGAFLDVFETEPLPPDSPLWRTPRLVISPHCIMDSPDYVAAALGVFFDNVARYLDGTPLRNVVDLERRY